MSNQSADVLTLECCWGVVGPSRSLTIDLDGVSNASQNGETGITVLGPGDWVVQPVAGTYMAWSAWFATTGCAEDGTGCSTGWLTHYTLTSPSLGFLRVFRTEFYETPALALENSQSLQFTLGSAESVLLYIPDGANTDNRRGLSLEVTQVPEPGTALLLGLGLLGLGRQGRVRQSWR